MGSGSGYTAGRFLLAIITIVLIVVAFLMLSATGFFGLSFHYSEIMAARGSDLYTFKILFPWVAALMAMLIGGFVGAAEVISRYRDEPFLAIAERSAHYYIAINALLALLVYIGLLLFDDELLKFDAESPDVIEKLVLAGFLAGFGSLAIMRASIAKTQVSGTDVEIGPALFIDALLKAVDRTIDRVRASNRMSEVERALASFSEENLPTVEDLRSICLDAMQNLERDEMDQVISQTNAIIEQALKSNMTRFRLFVVSLLLQQVVGNETFKKACATLKSVQVDEVQERVGRKKTTSDSLSMKWPDNP